jgi:hybrid cluster-associated redox disulfide protein
VKKITEDTKLSELLDNPKAVEILAKYRLPCLSCPFAQNEMENLKIGEICRMYRINLGKILKDLNEVDKK